MTRSKTDPRVREAVLTLCAAGSIVLSQTVFAADQPAAAGASAPWPTYMADTARSGHYGGAVEWPMNLLWRVAGRYPPEPAWPPPARHDYFHNRHNLSPLVVFDRAQHPIAADGRIFYATSADDSVVCRDAGTGKLLWRYRAEAPVRLAPSYADGRIVFGGDDGYLVALGAADGRRLWRTAAVENDVRLPGNGRIIARHAIRTGVLVDGGVGHFCAGLFPLQGVISGTVDLETGGVIEHKAVDFSPQGYLASRDGRVFVPTGRVEQGAWLDVAERRGQAGLKPFAVNAAFPFAAISTTNAIVRGGDGIVAAFDRTTSGELWRFEVEGRAYGLAMAWGRLYVATDRGELYCFGKGSGPGVVKDTPDRGLPPPRIDLIWRIDSLLPKLPRHRGYALVLGASVGGELARALVRRSDFRVVLRDPDRGKLELAAATAGRRFSHRMAFHEGPTDVLPYERGLFNLVLADTGPPGSGAPVLNNAEIARVLAPHFGIDATKAGVVPRPVSPREGEGEWTHFYADAGNTACSGDTRLSSDLRLQWFGRPGPRNMVDRHNRTVAPLYEGGRLYLSGMDCFYGVDADNGTVLWELEAPRSARMSAFKSSGNAVAGAGLLHGAVGGECWSIDGNNGKVVSKLSVPAVGRDWGYIALHRNRLYGTTFMPDAPRWKLSQNSWDIGYSPNRAFICSDKLFCFEMAPGMRRVDYAAPGIIVTSSIAIEGGNLFFVESRSPSIVQQFEQAKGHFTLRSAASDAAHLMDENLFLVSLNADDLRRRWEKPVGDLGFQNSLFSMAKDGRVLLYGSRVESNRVVYDVHGFSGKDGASLWSVAFQPREQDVGGGHGELVQHGSLVGDTLYLSNAAIDVTTGQRKPDWDWVRGAHGCGTLSASRDFLYWRGANPRFARLGPKFEGSTRVTGVNRPGCWIDMIPAGGLLLMPEASSGCTCGFPIQASMAFRPD